MVDVKNFSLKLNNLIFKDSVDVLVNPNKNSRQLRKIVIKTQFYAQNLNDLNHFLSELLQLEKNSKPISIISSETHRYSIFYISQVQIKITPIKQFHSARLIYITASEFIPAQKMLSHDHRSDFAYRSESVFFHKIFLITDQDYSLYVLSQLIYGQFSFFFLLLYSNPFIEDFFIPKKTRLVITIPKNHLQEFSLSYQSFPGFYNLSLWYYSSPHFDFKIRQVNDQPPFKKSIIIPPLLSPDAPVYNVEENLSQFIT